MVTEMTNEIAHRLMERISFEYGCDPRVIFLGDSVGFNVRGREAGRVEQKVLDGEVHTFITRYSPDSQGELPVFYERLGKNYTQFL